MHLITKFVGADVCSSKLVIVCCQCLASMAWYVVPMDQHSACEVDGVASMSLRSSTAVQSLPTCCSVVGGVRAPRDLTRDQALFQSFLGAVQALVVANVDNSCSSVDGNGILDLGHGVGTVSKTRLRCCLIIHALDTDPMACFTCFQLPQSWLRAASRSLWHRHRQHIDIMCRDTWADKSSVTAHVRA